MLFSSVTILLHLGALAKWRSCRQGGTEDLHQNSNGLFMETEKAFSLRCHRQIPRRFYELHFLRTKPIFSGYLPAHLSGGKESIIPFLREGERNLLNDSTAPHTTARCFQSIHSLDPHRNPLSWAFICADIETFGNV